MCAGVFYGYLECWSVEVYVCVRKDTMSWIAKKLTWYVPTNFFIIITLYHEVDDKQQGEQITVYCII